MKNQIWTECLQITNVIKELNQKYVKMIVFIVADVILFVQENQYCLKENFQMQTNQQQSGSIMNSELLNKWGLLITF